MVPGVAAWVTAPGAGVTTTGETVSSPTSLSTWTGPNVCPVTTGCKVTLPGVMATLLTPGVAVTETGLRVICPTTTATVGTLTPAGLRAPSQAVVLSVLV